MILKYSVGLDISLKDIKAALSSIDRDQVVKVISTTTILNTKAGFMKLKEWLDSHCNEKQAAISLCMEATGVYHENCALYFHKAGMPVSVLLPNKAKRYLQSLGLKGKNDSIDARGLSRMEAEQNLPLWQPLDGYFYCPRDYTRQHQALQEQRTVANNQLHAEEHGMYVNKLIVKQLNKQIAFIDKQIKELATAIKKHIDSNPLVAKKVENICQIKGLAILSVATVLAETSGFELFENYKQVVSFAGYDVVENQSGNHIGKTRISKKGNARIRRVLHMPALTAMIREPRMAALYQRTLSRHGVKMKSVVAVQKKLLLMIYYLYKKEVAYNGSYQNNMEEKELTPFSGNTQFAEKKVAPNKVEATQGKHGTKNRSTLPLGESKIRKMKKTVGI